MTKKLYIIDGHAHIYAAYYAPMRPLTGPAGQPTKASYIFTTILLSLIRGQKPDMLVVAMDSKKPSFRCEIYPEYKAHRPPMPEDLPPQLNQIDQILAAMNIPVIRIDHAEADDIIGTLAKDASGKGLDVFICSKDKDMLQLLDQHVCIYDIKNDRCTTAESMKEEMGLAPEQFIDCLALQGDTADNIPGVPDVGPKTAIAWIRKYGSIENLFNHIEEITGKKGLNLRNSKDLLALSKELVTINCNIPFEIDYDAFAFKEPDKEKLIGIFSQLGFNKLLADLNLVRPAGVLIEPEIEMIKHVKQLGERDSAKTIPHKYHLIDTPELFESFLEQLKQQKLFAFDTETTSINPMAADLVGISFAWEPRLAYYLPVKAPLGQKYLDVSMLRQKLSSIFADEKIKKIGQNIKYDLLVMKNAGFDVQGVYFDTMVASYCLTDARRSHSMDNMALDFLDYQCIPISALIGTGKNQLTFDMVDTALAAEYSGEDSDITFQLYQYLSAELEKQPTIKELFEKVEMPLVNCLVAIEFNGVSIDTILLRKMSHELADAIENLTKQIYEQAQLSFNIASPKQLAEVLFDNLSLVSSRTGKENRSTDASVLEELIHQHDIVPLILQHRQLSKLQNTYVEKLPTLINPKTNRVHASFNQTITATGRLSSSDPNLQNIPIRTELGKKIRSAIVPQKSTDSILSADYSQIELRLLAHFSGDQALIRAFANNQDIHRYVASQVWHIKPEEVTDQMRSNAKAVNFGIIYGQGAFGLAKSLAISRTEAQNFIDRYFARYSSIRQFMDDCIEKAGQLGYVETMLGRRRKIEGIDSKNRNTKAQAERLVVNTLIQGSAADLIKVAMINIQQKIEQQNLPVKMIIQVHDELVFEMPHAQAQVQAAWIASEMSQAVKLNVPLKVDIAIGPTWLEEK